jgi:hypothetical protein
MKANVLLVAALVAAMPISTSAQEGRMPAFSGATGWLNSAPLSAGELRGKWSGRVLTYTCINWLRHLTSGRGENTGHTAWR